MAMLRTSLFPQTHFHFLKEKGWELFLLFSGGSHEEGGPCTGAGFFSLVMYHRTEDSTHQRRLRWLSRLSV